MCTCISIFAYYITSCRVGGWSGVCIYRKVDLFFFFLFLFLLPFLPPFFLLLPSFFFLVPSSPPTQPAPPEAPQCGGWVTFADWKVPKQQHQTEGACFCSDWLLQCALAVAFARTTLHPLFKLSAQHRTAAPDKVSIFIEIPFKM